MKKLKILYLTLFIIIIDQVSKLAVKGFSIPFLNINVEGLIYGEKHNIINSFFRITFVENPGMAFGIDFGISSKLFLSLFSVAASIGIIIYLYKIRNDGIMLKTSLALILGGAIGNLIDRVFYGIFYSYAPLFYGKVVDFIDIDFFDISLFGYSYDRWPIFNIADMSVSIGVILLIFFSKKTEPEETPEQVIQANDYKPNLNNPSLTGHFSDRKNGEELKETSDFSNNKNQLPGNEQSDNDKEVQI